MWERVGDVASSFSSPSFALDGTMWSTGFDGLARLPPPYGPSQPWTFVRDEFNTLPVLALGQDTLVAWRNTGPKRSTDNGATFEQATFQNASILDSFDAVPYGLPFGGTLLAQTYGHFAAYSRDRGANWRQATIPNSGQESPGANDLAVVRRGEHAGRIVGAGAWGLATSDDGGVSYTPVAGLWQYFRFYGRAVAVLDRGAPGGGDRLVATLNDPTRPGRVCFVLVSDDGGDSWRETFTLTGDPNGAASEIVDMGGGRAVIAMDGGHIWATADVGESWRIVGVVPGSLVDTVITPTGGRVKWALRGPDGRLYAGGTGLGGVNPGWAFRTVAPFVAGEVEPDAAPGVGVSVRPNPASGRVEVVLSLQAAGPVRVAVVDALGREVAVVLDGAAGAGETVAPVETGAWPAGVYVVRVTAGVQTATARLVLAR